ncbi:flagellar hook assembly protein FlgD [Lignipirellula cremea]|uniref:Basal-body rod modification protein FlgD n=1 Tax=Lignipirellula cremea TaxID=2528010 RepID=A0A518DPN4_9BACT|nr:flagellar hook capping FlgD N-terminal domain-containing protein [Lignipirellula cremea]QDU93786.1 Basal-body rod modification protein FlgD [Lignipirellula cremea]
MSRIAGTDSSQFTTSKTEGSGTALGDVDLDQFLQLMIAEMQNQDPLNPMENSEMLAQIAQLREISSSDKLTSTLGNVSEGQSLATASGLIGKTVSALDEESKNVTGVVDRISVDINDDGIRQFKVHIDGHSVDLDKIREVIEDAAPAV